MLRPALVPISLAVIVSLLAIAPPARADDSPPVDSSTQASAPQVPPPHEDPQHVAQTRRALSWLTLGAGVVLAGSGLALALVEQSQLPAAESELAAANAKWVRGSGQACDFSLTLTAAQQSACENLLNDSTTKVSGLETRRRAGWVMFGVGSGVAVVGVLLLVLQRDPFDHSHEAREGGGGTTASLLAGWKLLPALAPGSAFVSATRSF